MRTTFETILIYIGAFVVVTTMVPLVIGCAQALWLGTPSSQLQQAESRYRPSLSPVYVPPVWLRQHLFKTIGIQTEENVPLKQATKVLTENVQTNTISEIPPPIPPPNVEQQQPSQRSVENEDRDV